MEVVMTTNAAGGGFVVVGTSSVTLTDWPEITPGPVPGSDISGAYPNNPMPAGGAALIETGYCSICQNAITTATATAKGDAGLVGCGVVRGWQYCVLLLFLAGTCSLTSRCRLGHDVNAVRAQNCIHVSEFNIGCSKFWEIIAF